MSVRRTIVIVALLAVVACLHGPVEKYPDGGQLVCDQGQVCGPGTVCLQGFCVQADGGGATDAGAGDGGGPDAGVDGGQDGGPDGGADAGPCPAGCPADQICADDGSKCVARFLSLRLDKPSANAVVGPAGVAVESTLTLGATAVTPPPTIDLLVDGTGAGTLGLTSQTGAAALYSGSYTPPAAVDDTRVLQSSFTPAAGAALLSNLVKIAADTTPPVLQGLSVVCDETPCKRDGILTVGVTMTETHPGTIGVQTDLDGWVHTVPMTPGAVNGQWTAQVALREWAFPMYDGSVKLRVAATDVLSNSSALVASNGVGVTRTRWFDTLAGSPVAGVGFGEPVASPGGMVFAYVGHGSSTALRGYNPDGTRALNLASPPEGEIAIGAGAIWIVDASGNVNALDPTSGAPVGAAFPSSTSLFGKPAVSLTTPERTYLGGTSLARLFTITVAPGYPLQGWFANGAAAFTGGVVIGGVYVFGATYDGATTTQLARYYDVGGGNLSPDYAVTVAAEGGLEQAPSIEATGDALFAVATGRIYRLSASARQVSQLAAVGSNGIASSLLIDGPSGDMVFAVGDGTLRRLSTNNVLRWSQPVATPLAGFFLTERGKDGGDLLLLDQQGRLVVLDRSSGQTIWTGGGGFGSLFSSPPALVPGVNGRLPLLVAPGSNSGNYTAQMVAMVVDGALDPTSPWPKAFHDSRNTSNSASPLP